jgi:hypothetical protein
VNSTMMNSSETTSLPMTSASSTSTSTTPMQTSATTSSAGGGIPEFPFQLVMVSLFTVVIAVAYLVARSRATLRAK